MFQKPDVLMAAFLALPAVLGVLPFIVMGKLNVSLVLKWVAFFALGVVAMSLLAALLGTCSFQETLFLARPTHECGPIPMLRGVFGMYVLFLAGLASVPIVALASVLRRLKHPEL